MNKNDLKEIYLTYYELGEIPLFAYYEQQYHLYIHKFSDQVLFDEKGNLVESSVLTKHLPKTMFPIRNATKREGVKAYCRMTYMGLPLTESQFCESELKNLGGSTKMVANKLLVDNYRALLNSKLGGSKSFVESHSITPEFRPSNFNCYLSESQLKTVFEKAKFNILDSSCDFKKFKNVFKEDWGAHDDFIKFQCKTTSAVIFLIQMAVFCKTNALTSKKIEQSQKFRTSNTLLKDSNFTSTVSQLKPERKKEIEDEVKKIFIDFY